MKVQQDWNTECKGEREWWDSTNIFFAVQRTSTNLDKVGFYTKFKEYDNELKKFLLSEAHGLLRKKDSHKQ